MAVLRCTVCGGELEVSADRSVGVCKFCDSVITIPKELDKKGNLYNRANYLRQSSQFDDAVKEYENILREDNSDAEAHWGLVLSRYGIEYVSDPKTKERKPTCHRTRKKSILSDPDYLAAIENADVESRKVYEEEAKKINTIQTEIIKISQKEKPYDVFICYKESDETGKRTEDSVIAQELYYGLVRNDYRVFFAKKSLENKLGEEYEPYIFAALDSAKVMIVLGTRAEYFNAVWVKNEWSRFMNMAEDAHKTIIPAYRGISPYELPAELSALQSLDMSKIGFMQDLTDGIERCLRGEKVKSSAKGGQGNESDQLNRLLQNCETYVNIGNYESAQKVYTSITEKYPEEYRGWWGLIVCKTKNFTDVMLDQDKMNVWFEYTKKLADPDKFRELEDRYVEYTREVSKLAAQDDMRATNGNIISHNSRITQIKTYINSLHRDIENRKAAWADQREAILGDIHDAERSLDSLGKQLVKKIIGLSIGWVIFAIGLLLLRKGGWSVFFGIVFGAIGIFVVNSNSGDNNSFKDLKNREKAFNDDVRIGNDTLHQQENIFNNDINSLNNAIENCKQDISTVQDKIEDCKRYLNLGKEKISELWFSSECKAFGVEKPVDRQILGMRNAAFSRFAKAAEKYVDVVCPACGERFRESEEDIAKNGYAVCRICGNKFPVNNEPETETADDFDHQEKSYTVTCPGCDHQFSIDENAYNSGVCYCQNCGTEIKFENA